MFLAQLDRLLLVPWLLLIIVWLYFTLTWLNWFWPLDFTCVQVKEFFPDWIFLYHYLTSPLLDMNYSWHDWICSWIDMSFSYFSCPWLYLLHSFLTYRTCSNIDFFSTSLSFILAELLLILAWTNLFITSCELSWLRITCYLIFYFVLAWLNLIFAWITDNFFIWINAGLTLLYPGLSFVIEDLLNIILSILIVPLFS